MHGNFTSHEIWQARRMLSGSKKYRFQRGLFRAAESPAKPPRPPWTELAEKEGVPALVP